MCRVNFAKSCLFLAAISMSSMLSAEEHTIEQKDKAFVLSDQKIETFTVNVGDSISFKNQDPWFHNIFSLSDISTFDLGSYPKGEFRTVKFETPGEAEIECAIHPQMYLVVEVKE